MSIRPSFVYVLLVLTASVAVACSPAAEATPAPTETPLLVTVTATATPNTPADPTATVLPVREWDLEGVQVEGSQVTVTLRVLAGIDVSVSLDGMEADRVDAAVPILDFVFEDVEDGQHVVLVSDVVGHSLTREIAIPGVGQQVPIMESVTHMPQRTSISYSTDPPTSGPHWAQWLNCGVYAEELPDELIVHNLEHSNIIVSYNLALDAEIADLEQAVQEISEFVEWGILRAYPYIAEGSVAVTGWGVIDIFEGVDADRIARFFEAYAGELGPERISCGE